MRERMWKITKLIICMTMIVSLLGGSLYVLIDQGGTNSQIVSKGKNKEIDLTGIFQDDTSWQETYEQTILQADSILDYKGTLQSENSLKQCLEQVESLSIQLEKLSGYATLKASLDQRNEKAIQMQSKVHYLEQQVNEVGVFLVTEMSRTIDKEELEQLRKEQVFEPYDQVFEKAIQNSEKGVGADMLLFVNNTYNLLQQTQEVYNQMSYADQQSNLEDRRYSMAALYQMEIQGHINYAKYGKYTTVVDYLLAENGTDRSVYEMTKQQVHELLPLLKHYLSLYAKRSANGYTGYTKQISYDQVPMIIEDSFAVLGETYQNIAHRAFEEQWISPFSEPHKEEGAYSLRVYGVHPYMVMNYKGSLDDVGTVAHELGHMIHIEESEKYQPFTTSHPDIMTTEIAASVAQKRVYHAIEQQDSEFRKQQHTTLWFDQLINSFFYQMMIAEFEEQTHLQVEKGEGITADQLDAIWAQLTEMYFGEYFGDSKSTASNWMTIPHLYGEFYTLQYVSATVVAHQVLNGLEVGDDGMKDRWNTFLRAGSSQKPYDLIKEILGIDLAQKKSYEAIKAEMEEQINRLDDN